MPDAKESLGLLAERVRVCRICAEHLPLGPRPVFRVQAGARLLIIGQAPGTKVHQTGIPWNDRSGDRLRDWCGLDSDSFYDAGRIAIMPMGFCYPGRDPRGGDNPPRPECAPAWHGPLMDHLAGLDLILLVGLYAQRHYLKEAWRGSLTATVAAWADCPAPFLPLPHPSWRTMTWQRKNPWFETELLPVLRQKIASIVTA
ncbi:MAG: uracil-DNA glycosylase family protein [Rhodospirillales bacterium]